ncbi:MAG: M3 family metallopeptidase [Mucinivorans sp.]
MKKLILATLMSAITLVGAAQQNPLLDKKWDTPHQTPPFSQIRAEHFVPAVRELIKEAQAEVRAIYMVRSVPTFDNTIVALDRAGNRLTRAMSVLSNLLGSNTNDSLQKIILELSPELTAYENDISLNELLFARVKEVYRNRAQFNLDTQDSMLLEKSYKGFVRSGANLTGADKERYREITTKLSELSLTFTQNELAATNAFTVNITNKKELKGLPDWAIQGAKAEAQAKGLKGYLLTLNAPSYIPVMTYCQNRALREKMWRAFNSKSYGGEFDNQDVVKQLVNLRREMAQLLGFKSYADFALEERMAQSATKVYALENELLEKSKAAAQKDLDEIQQYASGKGFKGELMNWDFSFWSEKYKQVKYAITDDMTRPYFQLENCEKALFILAGKLYGLTFKENKEIPTCHPDAKAYEVFDANGEFLSVLYLDYFPRASKNSGAWMTTYREADQDNRPIVTLVTNFTKPTPENPSLLSFNEFTTILHEFGHGLHGILAKGRYSSLTGTNVYCDFVELPSQLMENWAYQKEFLDLFAIHYKTGEKIPQELIEKIVASKKYLAAYGNIRQLLHGFNDMAWHTMEKPFDGDVRKAEIEATRSSTMIPMPEGTCLSTSFGHIFAGQYAAGYYSYKWAEVLEANAFDQFLQHGIFDPTTARKFRTLLEAGGSEHPMTLFVRFTGAEPTVEPLLHKMGVL